MKRRISRILAFALIITVLVGTSGAYALGTYDYDALGGSAAIFVDGNTVTVDPEVAVAGEVTAEDGTVTISGVKFLSRKIGDWTTGSGSGSSGEASGETSGEATASSETSTEAGNTEEAIAGQTGIVVRGDVDSTQIYIGGKEDLYEAPDGRSYNTVIELWADDKDTENALNPGTTRSLLDNDVESFPGIGVAAVGDLVTVENAYVLTEGANRSAFLNSSTMGQYVDTVITDSTLVSLSEGWIFPAFKCIYRAARATLCTSYGNSWMYNTRILSDSWGNYSMEGANGIDYYYVINCLGESYVGGYGLFTLGMGDDYAVGNNNVFVYGARMISPQFGWICDDGPNVLISSMANIGSDEHAMDHYEGEITEDMYLSEGGRSFFGGAVNAAVICFDMAPYTEMAAHITIEDSVFTTVADDLVFEDGTKAGNLLDLDPSILHNDTISAGMEYFGLGYVSGAVLWLRGANTCIDFIDSELRSETGVLFHSTVDYSNWSGSNLGGLEAVGYTISMKDMAVEGDIIHDDYQRKLYINLDGTSLTGAANYYTCEQYAARMADYVAAGWAEAEASKAAWEAENGAGSSLLGTQEDVLSWLVYEEIYDDAMNGLELSLSNGAEWNVTGESCLTRLEIGEGCVINGVLSVNGVETEAVPGVYEGDIIVTA